MKNYTLKIDAKAPGCKGELVSPQGEQDGSETRKVEPGTAGSVVCLGLDVHEKQTTVVRQVDGLLPQPAQRFERERLLEWVGSMVRSGHTVHSCYEAGCFGYHLHRGLVALGVHNLVVAPQNWCGQAKTDKRDAREMCLRLERYVKGNTNSFSVVRVPTLQQERDREQGRHRERLLKERMRAEMRGGALLRLMGMQVPKRWWQPAVWAKLRSRLQPTMAAQLEVWQRQCLQCQKLQVEARKELTRQGLQQQPILPSGLGALSWRLLQGEILDWSRFKNRRAVASYTGLCPGEESSGEKQRQGAINRHGNRRVRTLLIEAAWRLTRFEKTWRGFAKFPVLLDRKAATRARKRAVVAAARLLAIDLWRLACGHTKATALGFSKDFVPAASASPA
jgi:transposase